MALATGFFEETWAFATSKLGFVRLVHACRLRIGDSFHLQFLADGHLEFAEHISMSTETPSQPARWCRSPSPARAAPTAAMFHWQQQRGFSDQAHIAG